MIMLGIQPEFTLIRQLNVAARKRLRLGYDGFKQQLISLEAAVIAAKFENTIEFLSCNVLNLFSVITRN